MSSLIYKKIAYMLNLPENVVKKVLDEKEKDSKISAKRIVQKVSKELGFILQDEDVQEIIQKAKELVKANRNVRNNQLKELNEAIEDKKKYDFIDNQYVLYTTKSSANGKVPVVFKLDLETVDSIFNDYSKHWGNMSWEAICKKYKLKPKVRSLIKSQIWLYKDSHILSPMSMDIATENGTIEAVIEEATYNNYQDKYKDKYYDIDIEVLRKDYKRIAKIQGTLEGFLKHIEPLLNSIKPIKVEVLKHKVYKWVTPVYHFGDTHLGKRETDKVIARMDAMANDIIKEPSKDIVLNCWGDIFETLVAGGMHTGQVEGMDWVFWYELFMYSVNVYVNMLTKILKSGKRIKFIGIGGNHDRPVEINDKSPERTYALIFYKMLESYLKNANIEFQIVTDRVGKFTVDWIDYLMTHEPLHNGQPEKMGWKYGSTDNQTVYVHFDRHKEDVFTGKNITQVGVNAMAWSNDYDTRMWLHWYTGYTKTRKNEFGLPDYLSKRLP